MRVIAHGGAGSPPDEPGSRRAALRAAADSGAGTETPIEAVCATVRALESDPQFNAGVGGAVQSDGVVRTDAGLMTGEGAVGAAGAMPGVEHAVEVARAVTTETPHVLLAGDRAVKFAEAVDVETGVDLWTAETRDRWAETGPPTSDIDGQLTWVRRQFGSGGSGTEQDRESDSAAPDRDRDTVGAVASDGDAIATATSTGGRWAALAGRVGDVPQVGAGFYASPAGGASATGAGEDIAREGVARRAVDLLERGADAGRAAEVAIAEFGAAADGDAGVIVMAADGSTGAAYNSPAMATAKSSRE